MMLVGFKEPALNSIHRDPRSKIKVVTDWKFIPACCVLNLVNFLVVSNKDSVGNLPQAGNFAFGINIAGLAQATTLTKVLVCNPVDHSPRLTI